MDVCLSGGREGSRLAAGSEKSAARQWCSSPLRSMLTRFRASASRFREPLLFPSPFMTRGLRRQWSPLKARQLNSSVIATDGPVDNPDPTAKRMRLLISKAGIRREQVVFWNFFAAYEERQLPDCSKVDWSREIERLIGRLSKLKAILVFGDLAWRGMRDVAVRRGVMLIGAPHPSNRGGHATALVKSSKSKPLGNGRRLSCSKTQVCAFS